MKVMLVCSSRRWIGLGVAAAMAVSAPVPARAQTTPPSQAEKVARPRPAAVPVAPKLLDEYVGHYELDEQRLFSVHRKGGVLKGQAASGPDLELIAQSATEFIWFNPDSTVESQIVFVRDDRGRVTHAVLRRAGRDVWRAPRLD